MLYRSALQANLIEAELTQHGVLGGQSMHEKKEVKDAQAYLEVQGDAARRAGARGREIPREPSRFLLELPEDGSVETCVIEKEEMSSAAMDDVASAFLAQIRRRR